VPNEFGLREPNALDTPFGLRVRAPVAPVAPSVPVPAVRIPLPPQYMPMGAMPRAARQIQPMLSALSRATRGVANVLPFPAAERVAAITEEAAKHNQKTGKDGQITLADLTHWQRKAESSGNYTALNRERPGNTASGAYQYTDGTWNGYGGYKKALYAPKEVQDRRFADDIASRYRKYGGDPFKTIAAHYLPAYAGNPSIWNDSLVVSGQRVKPIATYIRQVIRGTPLEAQFDEYLASIKGR
jgi:hypothetical protein